MAIKQDDQQIPRSGGANFNQQPEEAPQYKGPQKQAAAALNFHTGGLFGSVIDRSVRDSQLRKTFEKLVEMYKGLQDKDLEVYIDMVDNVNNPALRFSAIVVALTSKSSASHIMTYYTIIFESSGTIEPRSEQIPVGNGINKPVEIILTAGDAFDNVMIGIIEARLHKAYSNKELFNTSAMVIPRSFNPEVEGAVYDLGVQVGTVCGTALKQQEPNFNDLNMSFARDGGLRINLAFNRDDIHLDAVGLPVRSDIVISLTSHIAGGDRANNSTINNGDRITKILEITGFVDLVYSPLQPQMNAFNSPYGMQQQQQPGFNVLYTPRFVITSIKSDFSYTRATVLLAMYVALAAGDKMNWAQTFLSTRYHKENEIDFHDIGYINLETRFGVTDPNVPFGEPLNTRNSSFGISNLADLLTRTVRPELMVSIDIPECGDSTWALDFLTAAANGNPTAVLMFEKAANELTNGAFSKMIPPGSSYFTDVGNKQHLGYYTARSESGTRDIRDVDRLAILNFFSKNPQDVRNWDDTSLRVEYPQAIRMAERMRYIRAATGETAVVTGRADRVTPTGVVMKAIAEGCKSAGMSVTISSPLSGTDINNQRQVATFVNDAIIGNNGMFNNNQGTVYGGTPQRSTGRWSH